MLVIGFQKRQLKLVRQVHLHQISKKVLQNMKNKVHTAKPTPRWRLGAECHDSPVEGMDDMTGQRCVHLKYTKAGPVKPTLSEPCPHPLGFNAYAILHGPRMIQKLVMGNGKQDILTMQSRQVDQEMYRIPQVQRCGPAKSRTCHTSLVAKAKA